MMRYRRTVAASVTVAMALFVLFHFDLIRKVPGFYCEGFGCTALGIVLLVMPLLIAVVFFVFGVLFMKERRLKHAFCMALIALVFTVPAVVTTIMLKRMEVDRATQEACRADPATYCPHTLTR